MMNGPCGMILGKLLILPDIHKVEPFAAVQSAFTSATVHSRTRARASSTTFKIRVMLHNDSSSSNNDCCAVGRRNVCGTGNSSGSKPARLRPNSNNCSTQRQWSPCHDAG